MPSKKATAPAGYKTTRDGELHPIVSFDEPGDSVQGKFCGIKVLPSNYNKDGSVCWLIKSDDDELFLINEKTTMKDLRISTLKENDDIFVVYHGMKKGKNRSYKDFEVFIKE